MAMIWAMASTPFSGVRISWLMLARKCDFRTLAASAASRASTRAVMALRSSWSLRLSWASRSLKLSVSRPNSSSATRSTRWAKSPLRATSPMARDSLSTGLARLPASQRPMKRASPAATKNSAPPSETNRGRSEPKPSPRARMTRRPPEPRPSPNGTLTWTSSGPAAWEAPGRR